MTGIATVDGVTVAEAEMFCVLADQSGITAPSCKGTLFIKAPL